MLHFLTDLRFALRLARRSPGFFALMAIVIAAGIGVTTAMFSLTEALFLKPLPYPNPEQLVMVWRADSRVNPGPASIPDFQDWKAQGTSFSHMTAFEYSGMGMSSPEARPESLQGSIVSGDFFPLFGVPALRGRLLGPEDDKVGGPHVAVISAGLWKRRFGSDPNVVGSVVTLNGEVHTIVGVAGNDFAFGGPFIDRADVWTPLATTQRYAEDMKQRGNHFLQVIGRLKPGISISEAEAQLKGVAKSLEVAYPNSNTKKTVRLRDLHDELIDESRSGVGILFAAVLLVFVIVCANVANLLLTRAQSRRGEMAARAALGATAGRLARQMVTETAALFVTGGLAGAVLARFLVDWFADRMLEGGGVRTIDTHVDGWALLFSVGMCLVCGLIFGVVPALAVARVEPQAVLKESATRASIGRAQRVVRSGLVVAQVALAFGLLAGSGLALRAFARIAATPTGFDSSNLVTARFILPEAKYQNLDAAVDFYERLCNEIAAQPGVTAVTTNDTMPMAGSNSNGSFIIEGRPPFARGDEPNMERNSIMPGYFAAMGIPVLRGREFTAADRKDARKVMVVNQAFADRFFPGEDPIGKRIDWTDTEDSDFREIVGVVGNVRRRSLTRPVGVEAYAPVAQHPTRWMVVAARSPRAPQLMKEIPAIVARVDSQQAVSSIRLMDDRIANTIGNQRQVAVLLAAFAGAALLLATLGIFGLVSYSTTQRTRELGIRMALGASAMGVVALVMKGGLKLLGLGMLVGLGCAFFVGRVLASRQSGIGAFDLAVYTLIPLVLGLAGVVASFLPAWRAVRIPPAIALRYE